MIKAGEKVTFVVARQSGCAFHCSTREGVMVGYGSDYCTVKGKNGKLILVRTDSVRLLNQKNALTEALLGKSGGVEQQLQPDNAPSAVAG